MAERPPDGHTATGRPYWLARRHKGDGARILGPWPPWPDDDGQADG